MRAVSRLASHPSPAGSDLSASCRLGLSPGHCLRSLLPSCLLHASTFLSPLAPSPLRDLFAVGSEEAHLAALTSVRLPNWTCRFPASSFHKAEHRLGCKDGIRRIKFTSPISP